MKNLNTLKVFHFLAFSWIMAIPLNARIEPHGEMFLLNLEQNEMEAAMQWLEKAIHVSVNEKGNDTSGTPYRNIVL